MTRATHRLLLALMVCGTSGVAAQAPQAPLTPMAVDAPAVFEVATIKPSKPDTPGKIITFRGRALITVNTTLTDLLSFVQGVHAEQIANAPAWMASDKYDITAQPEATGLPNERQLKAMLQKLFEDRFKLTLHRDKKELAVYALTAGKTAPKLTRSERDPNGLPGLFFKQIGNLQAMNANLSDLAALLQGTVLDRPVVDRSGVAGRYDFTLLWTPDESQFKGMGIRVPTPTGDPNAPPGLFTAIQEQLGLRLESTRAAADVIVIDRVERPSEN